MLGALSRDLTFPEGNESDAEDDRHEQDGEHNERLDADVVTFETRRDHHSWSASELKAIAAGASGKGAQALLVTGKDAVKLEESTAVALPIYRIDIESEISDPSALGALLDGVASLPPLAVLG